MSALFLVCVVEAHALIFLSIFLYLVRSFKGKKKIGSLRLHLPEFSPGLA